MDPKLATEGQLVIVVNHRPHFGRSLDGTLGRISRPASWLSKMGDSEYTYVDLYRRHRRTDRPLDLREEFMRTQNLRPLGESELEPPQKELVAHFGLVKIGKLAHRAKLRADNLAWERKMLALGGWAAPQSADAPPLSPEQMERVAGVARAAINELEGLLAAQPPAGTEPSRVTAIFEQHRQSFVAAIVELTVQVFAERQARKQQRATK